LETGQERMDPKPIVALLILSACANGVPSLKRDFELDAGTEVIAMGDKGLNDDADLEHHLPGPRHSNPASATLTPLTDDSPLASYYKLSEEPPGDWAGFGENSGTVGEWSLARNKRQVGMMLIKRRSTSERPVVRQNAVREGSRGRPKLVRQNAVDHS